METQLVTKYLETKILDCKKSLFTTLCVETGEGLIDLTFKGLCESATTNEFLKSKEGVKRAIQSGRTAILYLAVDECRKDAQVYTTYDRGAKVSPFVIVGWTDYEYLTLKTPLGVNKRHRGYFIVVPADEDMVVENYHYIPYKHFDICDLDDHANLVKEVWAVNDINKDITTPRVPTFELKIGENCIVCEGVSYCVRAGAHYHSFGNPLVPIREIAERLGYTVTWTKRKRKVDLISHNHHIQIFVDEQYVIINGEEIHVNFPATINKYTKRTYVNLSLLKRIFKIDAEFDKGTETVLIYTK